jgi:hypothetical protein
MLGNQRKEETQIDKQTNKQTYKQTNKQTNIEIACLDVIKADKLDNEHKKILQLT